MSDSDLVKRLGQYSSPFSSHPQDLICAEAKVRIEALEAGLRRMMGCNKPFTMKLIGGEGSAARLEQEEQIAAYRAAAALLGA